MGLLSQGTGLWASCPSRAGKRQNSVCILLATLDRILPSHIFSERHFGRNHKIAYSQISDFNCQRCKSENEEIFAIVSRFSNYFRINRTRTRNAISTSRLFTSSVCRWRTVMIPVLLDFSYFTCNWMWLQTLNLTLILTLTLFLTLKLTPILHAKSENLNMVVLGF